jgi:hypothetical protein
VLLTGGFTASGSDPVLRFDAIQGFSVHGSPVVPTVSAAPAPPLELSYDPSTRRLNVREVTVDEMMLPAAGFNAATGYDPSDPEMASTVLLGITGGPDLGLSRPSTQFAGAAVRLDSTGQPLPCGGAETKIELLNHRWGATITRIAAGSSTALIWGGNVDERAADSWLPAAGELVTSGSCLTTPVAGGGSMPDPTAFHTATPFQGGHIILAGGLLVNAREGSALQGFSTAYAQFDPVGMRGAVISVLSPTGSDPPFFSAPVGGAPPAVGRIFHTATAMRRVTMVGPDAMPTAAEDVVLIAGGAASLPGRRLGQLGELVTVKFDGASFVVVPAFDSAPAAPLIHPRWGHAAAPLPNGRLLITGGLRLNAAGDQLQTISAAEVFAIDQEPPAISACEVGGVPGGGDSGGGAADAGM